MCVGVAGAEAGGFNNIIYVSQTSRRCSYVMTCVVHGRTHLGVCTGAGGGRSGIGGKKKSNE